MSKQEIPALTKSGGMLSEFGGKKSVLEYRVWFHYHDGREDDFIVDSNLRNIQRRRKTLLERMDLIKVEQPLAVVWDEKHKDYREVRIDGLDY